MKYCARGARSLRYSGVNGLPPWQQRRRDTKLLGTGTAKGRPEEKTKGGKLCKKYLLQPHDKVRKALFHVSSTSVQHLRERWLLVLRLLGTTQMARVLKHTRKRASSSVGVKLLVGPKTKTSKKKKPD